MASDFSFDIVSDVDLQEVSNAVNQAVKEMEQRFDFKNSKSSITLEGDEIKLVSDDEFKLKNVSDILEGRIIKRQISVKALDYGKIEDAAGNTVRQTIKIQKGISKEKAKDVIATIKNAKLKVQAQIMDDQVRVTGKNKDELQSVIQALKGKDLGIELQFINYRSK